MSHVSYLRVSLLFIYDPLLPHLTFLITGLLRQQRQEENCEPEPCFVTASASAASGCCVLNARLNRIPNTPQQHIHVSKFSLNFCRNIFRGRAVLPIPNFSYHIFWTVVYTLVYTLRGQIFVKKGRFFPRPSAPGGSSTHKKSSYILRFDKLCLLY